MHVHLTNVNSTQDYLKSLLKERSGEIDYLVSCDNQLQGHGRGDKDWHGYSGGIYLSFTLTAHQIPTLTTLELACILADYLEQNYQVKLKLKWPNDLLIENKKCAGILIDHQLDQYIVGMGINLWRSEHELFNFASISQNTYQNENKKSLCLDLYQFIKNNRIEKSEMLKKIWLNRCAHLNQPVTILENSQQTTAIFKDIGMYGEAIVEEHGVQKKYYSASILI
jgi:BirA family transcriptional regulator, biotin operon repressor / biotin---[acetyl-CoA-carboxylase] ligase